MTDTPALHRWRLPFLILVILSTIMAAVLLARWERNNRPPNVVVVVLDTLRADRMMAERNGIPLMPYVTGMAGESLHFTHAISPSNWTKSVMASVLTSLYVDTHQIRYGTGPRRKSKTTDALSPDVETMDAYLRRAGYSTAHVLANGHLDPKYGLVQGSGFVRLSSGADADWVTDTALEALKELPRPYFLYVHYMDAHTPYTQRAPDMESLGFPENLDPADRHWVDETRDCVLDFLYHVHGEKENRDFPDPSPRGRKAVKTLYDAQLRHLDRQLARLLQHIRDRKENTYIALLADHGEELWDHASLGHGTTMFEELIHVPFFLNGPGIEPREVSETVETIDLLPTLADLLDLEPNSLWQGASLIDPSRPRVRPAFSSSYAPMEWLGWHSEQVQLDGAKLIVTHHRGTEAFYQLTEDPGEMSALPEIPPEQMDSLRVLLEQHRQANEAHRVHFPEPRQVTVRSDEDEALRALGDGT